MTETVEGPETLPAPNLRRDLPALAGMAALFLASIGLAMGFSATFEAQNLQAFENPDDPWNAVIYLGIVVAFTIVILLIAKFGKRVLIKYIILASVLMTIFYVVAPLLSLVTTGAGAPPLGLGVAGVVAAIAAVALTALLWYWPEWYVINAVGVLVAAGAAGIFGISFSILPCLLLLVAFAVYDAIAVYRTKHMLDLADSVLELRLPIMFVVPKTAGYRFLEETRRVGKDAPEEAKKEPREAMFMGLGDAVIPGVLAVSSLTFLDPAAGFAGLTGAATVALATLAGAFAGFCVLMYFVMKGRPHAGLPLLNGGAIAGFLLALLPLYGLTPLNPFA